MEVNNEMIMSKRGSRIMSFIIAIAFVLTGLAFTPKSADAAAEPEVSVLGASIRLGDGYNTNGRQSMRMAITVKNASTAKNCSVDLEVGGKTVTIATDGEASATTLTIVYHNNYTGSSINLSEYADCTYFEAKIVSERGETLQSGTQVCLRDSDNNEIKTEYIGDWNPNGIVSFNVPEGKIPGSLTINTQGASVDEPVTQIIYYIKAR